MHKSLIILIFLILANCQQNPVIKTHGVPFLDKKHKSLIVNVSIQNDVRKIMGSPSTTGAFNSSVWIYIERTTTRGKLINLGKNITSKNNVLALEFNDFGILIKKDFYDKNKINQISFTKKTTQAVTREQDFVYSFLSSIRQKINSPKQDVLKQKD